MKVIDFRFRPNTPETISGIQNSKMFKGLCESIDFSKMKPQSLDEVVVEMDRYDVEYAVITGRDCETTYGAKSNNDKRQIDVFFVEKQREQRPSSAPSP